MQYKTPISILALIHTPDLQVLLLERADKAGFWQSVTGSVEGNESLIETEHLFGLEIPSPCSVQLAPDEHVAYQWVDWRVAANKVFSWTNVEALRELGLRHGLQL